jgi:hypothetical protein
MAIRSKSGQHGVANSAVSNYINVDVLKPTQQFQLSPVVVQMNSFVLARRTSSDTERDLMKTGNTVPEVAR